MIDFGSFGQPYKDFVNGGDGNDNLLGTSGDDKINGKKGDDLLKGKAGDDILVGGIGQDTLEGGTGDDLLAGEEYIKTFAVKMAESLGETLDGKWEPLNYYVGPLALSRNWKQQSNNYLDGEDGNDTLIGGSGDDTLRGGNGNDTLDGAWQVLNRSMPGSAFVRNSYPYDRRINYQFNILNPYGIRDGLTYVSGKDILEGGNGNDSLWGRWNSDTLTGGDGDDYLNGGDGNDTLTGGSGADTFSFKILFPLDNTTTFEFGGNIGEPIILNFPPIPQEGIDLIKDFDSAQGDKIKIETVGVGEISIDQFDYNQDTGSIFFLGQQFAQLEGNPNFSLQDDLIV